MIERKAGRVEKKRIPRSNFPLEGYIDPYTLDIGGFNYTETSTFVIKEGRIVRLIISDADKSHPNMVIAIDQRRKLGGKGVLKWKDWYFGTFEGKPASERAGEEELKDYQVQLLKIVEEQNRIDPNMLEIIIKDKLGFYDNSDS